MWRTREANPDDAEAFLRIMSVVYRRGESLGLDDWPRGLDESWYVVEGPSGVAGAFTVETMRFRAGASLIPGGGVAAVAVLPEFRHQGAGRSMMESSLALMRERGMSLAALYGFRESYYRRFGYEIAGRRWQITCPQARLPRLSPTLPVRRVAAEDLESLAPCYEAFSSRVGGTNLRTSDQWRRRLGRKAPMIYAVGDPIEAYAWTHMEGGFWDALRIGEFVWATREGYESMLAVLAGLCVNRGALVWNEPSSSPFMQRWLDQGCRVELERSAMFRVLDVVGALRSLRSEDEGEFTLSIEDELLPANRGPWRVRFSPGETVVEPSGEAALVLSEAAFAQALLGEPSLDDLLGFGLARGDGSAARRLLPARAVCLYDFF